MSRTRMSRTRVALLGGLVAAAACLVVGRHTGAAGQPPVTAPKAADERPADQEAVRKALDAFAGAFQKGDARAVAAHWTAEGEYLEGDGTSFRGRAALEKAYAEFFAKSPGNGLEVEIDSIRFPSRDTAVVEGHFKLRKGEKKELLVSKCSFLYAREDGDWLIAIAREWPGDGLTIHDLEWLVGTWEAKQKDTVVRTTYEWAGNKAFLRCRFTITEGGQTTGGTQMIGKDPGTGALRVWTFEDEGGVGGAEVTRDDKKWVFHAEGTTADGRVLAITNLMTPVDADSFIWQSVERVLDDENLPDLPPVKVNRVADKK